MAKKNKENTNKPPEHEVALHIGNGEIIYINRIKYGRPKKKKGDD